MMKRPVLSFALPLAALGCGDVLGVSDFEERSGEAPPPDADLGESETQAPRLPSETTSLVPHGSDGDDRLEACALGGGGGLYVAGQIASTAQFGGPSVGQQGVPTMAFAAFGPSGAHRASVATGPSAPLHSGVDASDFRTADAQAHPDGVVFVGSYENRALEIGEHTLEGPSERDGFVLTMSPDLDVHAARRVGGLGEQRVDAVAVDPVDGSILVAGGFRNELPLAGVETEAVGEVPFLAELDFDGEVLWARPLELPGRLSAAAIDASGEAIVAGSFEGEAELDGHVLSSGPTASMLVARVGPDGTVVDARSFPADRLLVRAVATAGDSIHLGGAFDGSLGGGENTLESFGDPHPDGFLFTLEASDLSFRSARHLGGKGYDAVHTIAAGDGGVVAGGTFEASLGIDDATLEALGAADAFAVGLDSSGTVRWSFGFGGEGSSDAVEHLGIAGGTVFLTGTTLPPLSIRDQVITGHGANDMFVMTRPL